MAAALPLRAALKRGALVTMANWPVVVIELTIESLYKLALGVPIVGGAFMVAVLLGADLPALLAEGVRATTDLIIGSLFNAPVALATFLAALGLVALGGSIVMFIVKAGTLAVLIHGERSAGEMHRAPLRQDVFRRANAYSLGMLVAAARRFGRRAAVLAAGLGVVYLAVGAAYLLTMMLGFGLAADSAWAAAWPPLLLLATSASVVTITAVNLGYDLLRIIVVHDDCGIRAAFGRMRSFLVEDARHVLGIFGVMTAILTLATAASLMATASLALIGWVPVAGLIVVPLQAGAWIIRGLLFQFMGLTTLSAYQTQYRRFSEPHSSAAATLRVHQG